MSIRKAGLIALAALLATPALANDPLPHGQGQERELAESRLRGCLLTGSSAVPAAAGLREAIITVRAYCGAQLGRVRDLRVRVATAGLHGERADAAKDRAIRALNDEVARAIANFTGLRD